MWYPTLGNHPILAFLFFSYIVKVPLQQGDDDDSRLVYVWLGSKAGSDDLELIEEIAEEQFNSPWVSCQYIKEGEEPDLFWVALGGRKPYDTNADFMQYTRLFRCSNEKGLVPTYLQWAFPLVSVN